MKRRSPWLFVRGHLPEKPPGELRAMVSRVQRLMELGENQVMRVAHGDGEAIWTRWGMCADCLSGPVTSEQQLRKINRNGRSFWGPLKWTETPKWGVCRRQPCNGMEQLASAVLVHWFARLHRCEAPWHIVSIVAQSRPVIEKIVARTRMAR